MKTLLFLAAITAAAQADPQLTSWFTANSSKYARIYETDAARLAGTSVTTWGNGQQNQSQPAYAGIQSISYSNSWIYFNTTDLGPYIMGPWYDNAARSKVFVNLPKNQNLSYRIPRTSTLTAPPATKSSTMGMEDSIGFFVDGIALFDPTDGFSYANGAEASPGTGQWHRDAYVNESITFDPGNTHQQDKGKYHNHANPLALRYLLGDHVDFNPNTRLYSESTTAATKHSPVLGWMRDGYPIYGPYGYSDPLDAASGIRRMVGGFVKRDGTTTGVDNLTSAGRTLPVWATRNNGGISAAGPAVSSTYPLGRYIEDWAYLGDLVKSGTTKYQQGVDFDLNEYNVRYCVTPEFPNGTYAYFLNVSANGTPQFPYNSNRYYFGNPTGGTITAIAETVTSFFKGGADLQESASAAISGNDVTLTWSSVEGGTYQVATSEDLVTWTTVQTQPAASNHTATTYADTVSAVQKFYKVTRTALADYDSTGSTTTTNPGGGDQGISAVTPASGNRGSTVTLTITLNSAYTMAPPPTTVPPTSVTLISAANVSINASSYSRNSTTGIVTATFTLPANAAQGAYRVDATFGPNTWSLTNGFTVN